MMKVFSYCQVVYDWKMSNNYEALENIQNRGYMVRIKIYAERCFMTHSILGRWQSGENNISF